MASAPQYTSKTPTIRRLLKEAAELATLPDPSLTAGPVDDDLFEWHFTFRGPDASPYEKGVYHGRISLPPQYPLKPPSFRFLTPSGRFEVNREICLSISKHHEETWLPAWGIRTALIALRSLMADNGRGQIGGLESTEKVRESFAGESWDWKCSSCGKTNKEVMGDWASEVEEMIKDGKKLEPSHDSAPPTFSLSYKAEARKPQEGDQANPTTARPPKSASTRPIESRAPPVVARTLPPNPNRQASNRDVLTVWIDRAIIAVAVILVVLLIRVFKIF